MSDEIVEVEGLARPVYGDFSQIAPADEDSEYPPDTFQAHGAFASTQMPESHTVLNWMGVNFTPMPDPQPAPLYGVEALARKSPEYKRAWEDGYRACLRSPIEAPTWDHDPTRRLTVEDFMRALTELRAGHGAPNEVAVIVATGDSRAPGDGLANVGGFATRVMPDGQFAIVLEL